MSQTALIVEVTATVKSRQKVDLVELFSGMDERAQQRYRNLDITELGMVAEWERPLAYLWPEEEDLVPLNMAPGGSSPVWGDIADASIRLHNRRGDHVHGRDADWTENDFLLLRQQVPWLDRFHHRLENPLSAEDLARLPTPDDVPLFD